MGYQISAVPNKITQTASNHRDLITMMENQRELLRGNQSDFVSNWEGDASTAYLAELSRQLDFLDANIRMYQQVADFEEKSAECYIDAETKVQGIIDGL